MTYAKRFDNRHIRLGGVELVVRNMPLKNIFSLTHIGVLLFQFIPPFDLNVFAAEEELTKNQVPTVKESGFVVG